MVMVALVPDTIVPVVGCENFIGVSTVSELESWMPIPVALPVSLLIAIIPLESLMTLVAGVSERLQIAFAVTGFATVVTVLLLLYLRML